MESSAGKDPLTAPSTVARATAANAALDAAVEAAGATAFSPRWPLLGQNPALPPFHVEDGKVRWELPRSSAAALSGLCGDLVAGRGTATDLAAGDRAVLERFVHGLVWSMTDGATTVHALALCALDRMAIGAEPATIAGEELAAAALQVASAIHTT